MEKLEQIYSGLFNRECNSGSYFLISLKKIDSKTTYAAFYSMWLTTNEKKLEVRRISLIDSSKAVEAFRLANQKLAIIENSEELTLLLEFGGHALIIENVMVTHFPEILKPIAVVESYAKGYIDSESIAPKNRFARGNFRQEIFERDKHRCKICGSSPDDSIHVSLEIHHIKPWQYGGVSEPENLITLCTPCHKGINGADREVLYKKIGISFPGIGHLLYHSSKSNIESYNNIKNDSITIRFNSDSVIKKNV